ncbi:MAG: carbohydrate ABC transporter permease [Acidothermus sp.]|nr:carbohydrate ABC transporter permease [Acidothermus sp.]MCL6538609.1 carbohydrate ABC transporter permease [Acidothermus sp.]
MTTIPATGVRTSVRVRPRRSGGVTSRAGGVAAHVIVVVVLLLMLFPVYWAVSTSFKRGIDMNRITPLWFPIPGTFQHYRDAWHKDYFLSSLQNSAIVVASVVVISIAVAFLAAVAIARSNFRGRKAYIVLIMAIQMIPQIALILPLFVLLSYVHKQNTIVGLTFTYLAFILPFSIWTLRGFVANIPADLEEAAMIDGCSRFGAFMRVTFPLVAPGLVATAIFAFIQSFNEFIFAYVIMQDNSKWTASVWLESFLTQQQIDWGGLMAGATMLSIPIVIGFLLVQRYVAVGLTAGAVKG